MVCALVGMSALAVAVVGGPLTMAFLALESTGSLPLTVAVLAAAVVSALTVRRTFGYSFATWRFHLRGEAIRSAVDVGWMRSLTVGRMMRRDVRTVRADTTLAAFRRDFPLGATDARGGGGRAGPLRRHRAAGRGARRRLHAPRRWPTLLHHQDDVLLPQMTIKEAVAMFETAEADALAVVDGARDAAGDRAADRAVRAAALHRGTGPAAAGAVGRVIPTGGGAVPWRDVRPSPEIAGRSVRGLASGAARGAPRLRRAGTPLR